VLKKSCICEKLLGRTKNLEVFKEKFGSFEQKNSKFLHQNEKTHQVLMAYTVILATWEAEIRRIAVPGWSGQKSL
jgi:hypothetical protein